MKIAIAGVQALLASCLIVAAGCSDNTGPQPRIPTALRAETSLLTGAPGFAIEGPVQVRLVDRNGTGVPGFTVDFSVLSGGGVASPSTATTDADGYARAEWVLGSVAGEQSLGAKVRDMSSLPGVTIRAKAAYGREAALQSTSSLSLGTVIGACSVQQAVSVRVVDAAGAPVSNAMVDFSATAGGSLQPAAATSDAEGNARAQWTPGTTAGVQSVTASLRVPNTNRVQVMANVLPRATNGFAAIGATLIGPNCAPYIIRGMARPSLEWEPFGDPHFGEVAKDFANMKTWGANTVRLPVNQKFWVSSSAHYVSGYRAHVIATVAKARAAGLNVIFDLHIGDRGEANFNDLHGMPQMPDVNHSLPFWRDVARQFKDDGGVIFELYNEPHDVTVEMWRNGGTIAAGETYAGGPWAAGYQAIGMQQLYDAVRAEGAQNLVIVSGLHWGYYLDQIATMPLNGYNIAYAAHPYDWPDKQPEVWERDWGSMAAKYPVVVTEFGAYDCTRVDYYSKLMDYAEQKKIGWVAWAWWTPPAVSATYTAAERAAAICKFPSLINDWNGTPSPSGALVKARLQSAAAQ